MSRRRTETHTAYQRAHKRAEYKSEVPWMHQVEIRVSRAGALYDPMRDAQLHHADLTAVVMGDPPIGRRAIDAAGRPNRAARTGTTDGLYSAKGYPL